MVGVGGGDNVDFTDPGTGDQGIVNVNTLEAITFDNKSLLNLNGGVGNNTITVDNPNSPSNGLASVNVTGGTGQNTLVVNAFGSPVSVGTSGKVTVAGQPDVNYTKTQQINILNVLDSIVTTPATITGKAAVALNNVKVGSFTGGPAGAIGTSFYALINWGDGSDRHGRHGGRGGGRVHRHRLAYLCSLRVVYTDRHDHQSIAGWDDDNSVGNSGHAQLHRAA